MARILSHALLLILLGLPALAARAQATDVDCDKCVDATDIAGGAVSTYKLREQSVTASRLASAAVTTAKLKNGAVTEKKLAPAVSSALAAAANPLVRDGLGTELGRLVSIGENRWSIEVITDEGYLFTVSPRDGELNDGTLYFASFDCSGTGYIDGSFFGGYVTRVFDVGGFSSLRYVDKDSAPIPAFDYNSLLYNEEDCVQQTGQEFVFATLPNDPNVTGVWASSFTLPIKIVMPGE